MSVLPAGPIFISYSRRDSEFMQKIVHYLRDQDFKVWVDNEQLIPGTPVWEEEIEKAIRNASTVIVVMSPDSKNSEWVRREISLADQYRKHILPVLVHGDKDTSITLRLVTRQFIDLRQNENAGLQSLHTALLQHLQEVNNMPSEEEESTEGSFKRNIQVPDKTHYVLNQTEPDIPISSDRSSILWATLGWAFAGALGGYLYDSFGEIIGGACGGILGGLVTLFALQDANSFSNQKKMIWNLFAWTIGGAIGWEIGWNLLTEALGAGFGMTIFVLIGLVSTLGIENVRSSWKRLVIIALTWLIASAIGWSISKPLMVETLGMDYSISWTIGTGLAWAMGGLVLSWQLLKSRN